RSSRGWSAAALALVCLAPAARGQAIGQGFDLERQGRLEQAAAVYAAVLRGEPVNLPALLGLERVLPSLRRPPELLPLVQRARGLDSSTAIRALELRTYAALDEVDSAAAIARRWSAARPGDAGPWREWAIALQDHQRFADARTILLQGRQELG